MRIKPFITKEALHISYEPADLTVHHLQNCRGWVHFLRICVQCSLKNVLKGKPEYFGDIQVNRPKNVVFQHIHSNLILINLTFLHKHSIMSHLSFERTRLNEKGAN